MNNDKIRIINDKSLIYYENLMFSGRKRIYIKKNKMKNLHKYCLKIYTIFFILLINMHKKRFMLVSKILYKSSRKIIIFVNKKPQDWNGDTNERII